jgi:hypothetical protein
MKQINLIGESIVGALTMIAALFTFWLPYWRSWGANQSEIKQNLPGDNIVVKPKGGYTHAITISAPRQQVWLWVN